MKDVFAGFYPQSEYQNKVLEKMIDEGSEEITPPETRCLVEGAVEFARDCGFGPHPDYRKARGIFGDVDPSECTTEFTYGRDGMPVYIAGPYDSPQRQHQIISTLRTRCGDDGYDSTMTLDARDLGVLWDTAEVSGDEDAGYLEFDDDSGG